MSSPKACCIVARVNVVACLSMSKKVSVVVVDTTGQGSADFSCYKEVRYPRSKFTELIENRGVVCVTSKVAALCGLDLKVYFRRHRKGIRRLMIEGGMATVQSAMLSGLFAENNGAGTFLTVSPDTGTSDYVVCGKVYVVLGDGSTQLTAGQVWGIQEMVNCLMDIYDMDPENIRRGNETAHKWSKEYRKGTWEAPSGSAGMNIYGVKQ